MPIARVAVIGLDCAAPRYIFGPDAFDLPNLRALMERGAWGLLRSCDPPITVPAWACMTSAKDPGTLGCYGFRNRGDYSYDRMITANASAIHEPRVWDILSRHGKKCIVLGVPQTYPPKPLNGWLAGDFLAPDTSVDYTYPKSLKPEIEKALGEFILDVKDFRTDDKDALLKRIYAFMENRFAAARYLIEKKPWDFFMMVELGLDRLHHGFWKYCDPGHAKYEVGNSFQNVFKEYYESLDCHIGELLARFDDDTAVLVVSDHGAQPMEGGFCLNQWLMNEGYLYLREPVSKITRIEDCAVDWSRTSAWGSGGYYGRIFINVAGREPEGCVPPDRYDSIRSELMEKIGFLRDHQGQVMGNDAMRPEDFYKNVRGIPPDLLVYFGGLGWRAVGSVGFDSVYTFDNDTGPDDANHDFHGVFLMDDRANRGGVQVHGTHIMNIAPTILSLFDLPIPEDFQAGPVVAAH